MWSRSTILLLLALCQIISSSDLCKSNKWFDTRSGKCRPCQACLLPSYVIEPCTEFMDTLCVDPVEIERSIDRNIEHGLQLQQEQKWSKQVKNENENEIGYKWHESEDPEDVDIPLERVNLAKSVLENFDDQWGNIVIAVLCVTLIFILGSVLILSLREIRRRRDENRKNIARTRLFSRDRLNTTEYMNNLATLDRRLAMDEILEKRKKAIFEPHLLHENVYTDEVFVDISGLPRKNILDDREYEELDHTKCLLQIQDHQ